MFALQENQQKSPFKHVGQSKAKLRHGTDLFMISSSAAVPAAASSSSVKYLYRCVSALCRPPGRCDIIKAT